MEKNLPTRVTSYWVSDIGLVVSVCRVELDSVGLSCEEGQLLLEGFRLVRLAISVELERDVRRDLDGREVGCGKKGARDGSERV